MVRHFALLVKRFSQGERPHAAVHKQLKIGGKVIVSGAVVLESTAYLGKHPVRVLRKVRVEHA